MIFWSAASYTCTAHMDPTFQAGPWVPVTCLICPAASLLAKPQQPGDKSLLNPATGNSQSSAFKQNETKSHLKFCFREDAFKCSCACACHQAVKVTGPVIPAQRKRQYLKFLFKTIMNLTSKFEFSCFYLFRRE